MPSQKQLKWSQLRVGLTVIFASLVLGLLLFLMSGTGGIFTHRMMLVSFFDNAGGLRVGAPVRLSGVDIGNVVGLRIVPDKDKQMTPVEVIMKVSSKYSFNLRRDSVTSLDTAGVLGETYIDINSSQAVGPLAQDGDTLSTSVHPDFNEVVRSSQSTLQNMDALLDKMNGVIDDLQAGKGTAGKFLKDPSLYDNANDTIANLKQVSADLNAGKGPAGKLLKDEELAKKIDTTMTKLAALTSDLEAGNGTAGKLFKDETLYNNANHMLEETQGLIKAIRENPKKYLSIKLHIF